MENKILIIVNSLKKIIKIHKFSNQINNTLINVVNH